MLAACLGAAWAGYSRVELFHAAFVNGCTARDYQVHWQNQQRFPEPLRYDFFGTTTTFALVVIWLEDGPALEFSREFWLPCSRF